MSIKQTIKKIIKELLADEFKEQRQMMHEEVSTALHDISYRIDVLRETASGSDRIHTTDFNLATHMFDGYVVTDNSPTAGSVAWTDLKIVYKGTTYAITNGNSAMKYIYWDFDLTPTTLKTSDTMPTLTTDDVLIGINEGGKFVNMMKTGNTISGSAILDGTVGSNQLGSGAVTALKIANGAVGTTQLGDNAVSNAKIASGAVGSTELGTGAVTAGKIGTGGISASGQFASGVVGNTAIANTAVDSTKLADNAVTGVKLADGAVGAGKIGTGGISASTQFGSGVVNNAAIANTAVDSTKLADSAVTGTKIAGSAVDSTKLADNAVSSVKIANGAVTGTKIGAGAVAENNLNVATHFIF